MSYLKTNLAGLYDIPTANISNQLFIRGKRFEDYLNELTGVDIFEQSEIAELKAIVQRIDISALTGQWILDDTNRNAVLKTRLDNMDASFNIVDGRTKYITSVQGDGPIIPGTGALAPSYTTINPSVAGIEWNSVNLIANSSNSYIKIHNDSSVATTAGHNEIQIYNSNKVGVTGGEVLVDGTLTTFGSGTHNLNFPTLTCTQPQNVGSILTDLLTSANPAFIVAKIAANAFLPNYSDIFSFKTAAISRDPYLKTTNAPVIKDYTLYNLDAVNALAVESTFIAHGDIAKNCAVGNQDYWCGSGAITLRVDDFANLGGITLVDKENKTNKIKISNQNVEIRSNNGTSGNVVVHNGCPSGAIQFTKGMMNSDSTSVAVAMEVVNPTGASTMNTTQVIMGADTRQNPGQLLSYDTKSKVIVDTTQFLFSGTGKTGIHGIKVVDTNLLTSTTDTTYVDAANVNSKSFTLQDNYTGPSTKTLYIDNNANLMYNGQQVAVGSVAASGGGLTYIITCPTTTTITTPSYTYPTDLTMSGTYTSTVNRTITLSSYIVNTAYQLCTIKGLVPTASNIVLDGTYELNQHVNYTGSLSASLYAKLYFFANTPASALLINKSYTSPAGSGTVATIYGPYVPVPMNDLTLIITSVTFPQVLANSGSANSPLVCTVVNQSGTVLYTFPTLTATNNTTADRTFTPTSSPQTITVTSGITSFRFVLTNTAATTPTMSQASAANVNSANYTVANGSSAKMLLYDGSGNKTALTPSTAGIYALSLPLPANPFDITNWVTPYLQLDEFFIQPSGSTTGHTCVLQFNDGNLSHLHTSIASVSSTPTLSTVMSSGNSVGSNALNMNSQNINNAATINATTINATTINATTLVPTNITGWNVKSLNPGTGISLTNVAGAVTINSTADIQPVNVGDQLNYSTALPTKPFWYSGYYSWVSKANASYNYNDSWVSNTGQYQLFVSQSGAITYSVDWGVTYATISVGTIYISGVTCTAIANRIYYVSNTRIYYQDSAYSNFGTSISVLASSPTADYTKIKCSQDGKYIITGTNGGYGRIYISNDYGASWTAQNMTGGASNVTGVEMSADGKYMYSMNPQLGSEVASIRYSTDYGNTWTTSNIPASTTLLKIAASSTGQFVSCVVQSTGILISSDYGKNFTWAGNITYSSDVCMSANGQFQLSCYNNLVAYSEDYGRVWYAAVALSGSPAATLQTIACSATAGYAICGGLSGARTYVMYDVPTDVRQLSAGTGVTISNNGYGTYTINSSIGTDTIAFYIGTFYLSASSGNVITLPTSVNLQNYDMEIQLEAMLENSGTANTLFTIYYNGYINGRSTWTNQIHGNGEFGTSGSYPQCWLNPVWCYVPSYDSTSTIQYISSVFRVSKNPYTNTSYSPIITRFATAVGATMGTANQRFQDQTGHIQSGQGGSGFPTISTITIAQYSGAGGTFRNSYSGTPAQMIIYLKRKIPIA